jgi:hypothetical protein
LTHYIYNDVNLIRKRGFFIRQGITDRQKDGTIKIDAVNLSGKAIRIYPNMMIATSIPAYEAGTTTNIDKIYHINETDESQREQLRSEIENLDLTTNSDLNPTQQRILRQFLHKNNDLFATNPKAPGLSNKVQHTINVQGNTPIKQRAYRVAHAEKAQICGEIAEMLKHKIIRKSNSPWASPVVIVPKPDGSRRFCVDYRKLNAITKKDVYPLPRIDDTLDSLRLKKYFTSLDLASGYWQIPIKEEDREKTAFISIEGLCEFNVMPFGLTNAPATFQRMMDSTIEDFDRDIFHVYLNDIIVATLIFEDQLIELQRLFDCLRRDNLHLKLVKCRFCKITLKYLGHVVSQHGITPDMEKIKAVTNPTANLNLGLKTIFGNDFILYAIYQRLRNDRKPTKRIITERSNLELDRKLSNCF